MADSLYERVGGEEGITKIVGVFYDKLLEDPELAPFFAHSSPTKLRRMQRRFLAAALGGPIPYQGRSLQDAHAGRGISRRHIELFIDHLLEVLTGIEISGEDARAIKARINIYAEEITSDMEYKTP